LTKVINFCAGPSAGKTTAALRVASILKERRKNVLYVPEFAMELVVKQRTAELDDQLYLVGEQAHRLYMAKDKFDYIVTDAPVFMMLHYLQKGAKKYSNYWKPALEILIMDTFRQYDNYTFFVIRGDRKFLQLGRVQNEEESKAIDKEILNILHHNQIDYRKVVDGDDAVDNLEYRGIIPRYECPSLPEDQV
jgi:hypothetical protein